MLKKIMWRLISKKSKDITEEEIEAFYQQHEHMPHKGFGGIQVATKDVDKAHKVLKTFVGYDEYRHCPKDFITDVNTLHLNYYGKFEIENFPRLLFELIDNDIEVIYVDFFDYG